jgi:hypothetical protein
VRDPLRLTLRPHYDEPNGTPVKLGKFAAYLDGDLVCISSQPLLDGARALLARGHPAHVLLTTRHDGKPYDNFIPATIGKLACLTAEEACLGFRKYRPWCPAVGHSMRKSTAGVSGEGVSHDALPAVTGVN